MRLPHPLSLAGLALIIVTCVLAGSAFARQGMHPDSPAPVASMRALVDHYRSLTWTYERAAREPRTPSSFLDRRSTDRDYLQWAIDTWTLRSYQAQRRALGKLSRRLRVDLPATPRLHARLFTRVTYTRRLAIRLRRIYPGHVGRSFLSARAPSAPETLRLWQSRTALAALAVSRHTAFRVTVPAWLGQAFACIHHFEGAWTSNTGNGYYGGLQMDLSFQARYGAPFVALWGTADRWPAWAQLQTAVRAYQAGRGFSPWPNTARFCGLT